MPLLIDDARRLSTEMLLRGVIEQMITESSVLQRLPFMTVVGNSLRYNREKSLGSVDFYGPNDTWTESASQYDSVTGGLVIMGGDADVDNFMQQTMSNTNDLKAQVVASKAKATAYSFNDSFFNGDSSVNAKQFDGLKKIAGAPNAAMAYSQTVRAASNGANGAVLDLDTMDAFIDAVKPGKPDVLYMSKRTRRKLSSLRRASGNLLEVSVDAFGRRVTSYDGIPVEVDENIGDSESLGASANNTSSIYAVQFGEMDGVCGLQNGSIETVTIGMLETKDAWRTRIKWYCGLAAFRTWSYARLAGVKVA